MSWRSSADDATSLAEGVPLVAEGMTGTRWAMALLLAILVLPNAWAAPAGGVQRYRYVNDQGVVVLDQSIPTRFIDRGYTILSGDGQVVKVVPSATERKRLEEQQRVIDVERNRQDRIAKSDQELLRMYSSSEDIERARDRKLESIRTAIAITDGNLRRLLGQKKTLEDQGAQLERAGRSVAKEMVANLKIIAGQVHDRQIEIAARKAELERVRAVFNTNAQRVRELYSYSNDGARPGASPAAQSSSTAAGSH